MRNRERSVAAIAVFLVLAAACTDEPERDLPDVAIASPSESPSPAQRGDVPTEVGRIAVLDGSGNLLTVAPDGSELLVLAEVEDDVTFLRQPTWSPNGALLAWVRLDTAGDETSAVLVTAAADGSRMKQTMTAVAPFYLSWDPTSSRVAYLGGSSPTEIQLGLVELVEDSDPAMPLDVGNPFYFSWHPSGEQLLVHVGTDRLERVGLDGTHTTVDPRPGTFTAPVWTSDGRSVVYASEESGTQTLVVHDLDRDRIRDLVSFQGPITFVASPDGTRVAFQVLENGDELVLSVIDLGTGEVERVTSGVVAAYFWSPAGDKLLYLQPEIEPGLILFRWGVWEDGTTFTTPRFAPSTVLWQEYLRFFEQYAQSMSLWAPDGSAFTYAGAGESGEEGIWVQPAREGAEPILVAEGVFAAWSPA